MLASSGTRRPQTVDELISPELAAALDVLDVHSRRVFAGKLQGERRSKARGRSVEFEDYRQYVPGDDLRHIDWNVFARLDKFFIKVFQEEQDLALHIVLDASASMDAGRPNKLLFAQKVAMALGYLGLVNNNRVCVWVLGRSAVRRTPPLRGRNSVQRVARFLLEETFPDGGVGGGGVGGESRTPGLSFAAAMRTLATSRTGRGVMVVLSDLLVAEGFEEGLGMLAGGATGTGAPGWDVTLMQVLAPGELDPMSERDGSGGRVVIGDLRLTDAETGRIAEVTVTSELVKKYLAKLEAYQTRLHTFATARGMQHLVVRSDADLAGLMMDELRRRGVLR